jgi:hypothetical protein
MSDLVVALGISVVVAWGLGTLVVCGLKGKWWFVLIGIFLGWALPALLPTVGAIRVAKPGSWWDRRLYDDHPDKRRKQRERFYA